MSNTSPLSNAHPLEWPGKGARLTIVAVSGVSDVLTGTTRLHCLELGRSGELNFELEPSYTHLIEKGHPTGERPVNGAQKP